jgi:hypothetical protein
MEWCGGPVRGNNPSAFTGESGVQRGGAERVVSNRLSNTPTPRRARQPGTEARDTTKWRNVAPRPKVVIPRVVPDTTGREHDLSAWKGRDRSPIRGW